MFHFLTRLIPSRSQISPSQFHHLLSLPNQHIPSTIRYCTSLSSNAHSFTVSYLIHTCGFSPQEANSATKYVTFETPQKPDLVINFLKTHGFSKPQMLRFIKEAPQILRFDPHKTFLPKIEFFKSKGISDSHIPKLLCSHSTIMRRSLHKHIIPSFDFFRGLFQSDEQFIKSLTRFAGVLLHYDTRVLHNIKVLREAGVPECNVVKLLELYPRTVTTNVDRFKMIVKEVGEMGFDPLKYLFVMAVIALSSVSKATWLKKASVYKKWGWSDDDIVIAFRRAPNCMNISEDKIDAIMDVLVNKLGCPPCSIPKFAVVLSLSLKKRIVPRAYVIEVLLSKGLVKKKTCLSRFSYTERNFLKRCIMSHGEESAELLKLYQAKLDLKG